MGRIGPVRRMRSGPPNDDTVPMPLAGPTYEPAPGWSLGRAAGPLLLAVAALAVLAVLFFVVFGGDDTRSPGEQSAGGGGPVASTPLGTASGDPEGATSSPTESEAPSRAPVPLTQPTSSPTPRPTASSTPEQTLPPPPTPVPPPTGEFSASVHVCRALNEGECDGEIRRVNRGQRSVVLLVLLANASAGDVIGLQVSGPDGSFDAGSVVLQGGGDGYAFIELGTDGLASGDYVVVATRNGSPVASTDFVKRGD